MLICYIFRNLDITWANVHVSFIFLYLSFENLHPPFSYHLYSLWVERLYEDSSASGHALHQLIERRTFDLLPLQVGHTVQEIKQHAALLQLLTEQIM